MAMPRDALEEEEWSPPSAEGPFQGAKALRGEAFRGHSWPGRPGEPLPSSDLFWTNSEGRVRVAGALDGSVAVGQIEQRARAPAPRPMRRRDRLAGGEGLRG